MANAFGQLQEIVLRNFRAEAGKRAEDLETAADHHEKRDAYSASV